MEGVTGERGPSGIGFTGPRGETGWGGLFAFTGPVGMTGPVGVTGPTSSTGATGISNTLATGKLQKAGFAYPAGNSTITLWERTTFNPQGSFNATTGIYTTPMNGYYLVQGAILLDNNSGTNTAVNLMITKNSDTVNAEYLYSRVGRPGNTRYYPFSTIISCNTNDTISVMIDNQTGTAQGGGSQFRYTSFAIGRI